MQIATKLVASAMASERNKTKAHGNLPQSSFHQVEVMSHGATCLNVVLLIDSLMSI